MSKEGAVLSSEGFMTYVSKCGLGFARKIDEILKKAETVGLAFFRVELEGVEVSLVDAADEADAVICGTSDKILGYVGGVIGMDVVEIRGTVGSGDEGLRGRRDGIPSHVGDLSDRGGEADNLAVESTEARNAGRFLTFLKEELEAKADTEEGFILIEPFLDGGDEIPLIENVHGFSEMALAGEDNGGEIF